MKQKEIWLADLNPAQGSEQRGIRPVVIISGDAMNNHLGICIICPLSSKIKNYAGCLVLQPDSLNQLTQPSEIITFQIRTVARQRLKNKIGEITEPQLIAIKQGLSDILKY